MSTKRGNSLIEIIVALTVFCLILTAIDNLSFGNQFLSQNSAISLIAQKKAKSLIENTRSILANDFYATASSSFSDGFYTKALSTIYLDNFTREIKSFVGWSEHGKKLSIQLTALTANWKEAYGQDDCFLEGTENWQTPQAFGSLDLGYGNVATGLKVRGGFAYVTADNTDPRNANADKNDLFVIDVNDPHSPRITFKTDTGPGLSSIALSGNYAYLGNTSINGQLQIFNINDSHSPTIVSTYKLPGQYNDETAISNSLFYNKAKIYLGTAKSQIEELHIINVEDPSHPTEVGKWEVNAAVNAVYVNGDYAYMATPNSEELAVLNISDPGHIVKIGGFDAPGGSGNGKSLGKIGNTLYLGRTAGKNELFALDVSNPLDIKSLGSKIISNSINGLTVFGTRVFMVTNNKFQVMDTETPADIQSIGSLDLGNKATGIACSGKLIYISLQSNDGLRIIGPNP